MSNSKPRFSELRVTAPVLFIWCVAFLRTLNLAGQDQPQDWRTWWDYLAVAMLAAIFLMTVIWNGFYGRPAFVRLLVSLVMVVSAAYCAAYVFEGVGSENLERTVQRLLTLRGRSELLGVVCISSSFWVVAFCIFRLVHRWRQWRIEPASASHAPTSSPPTIPALLAWFTLFAVVVAIMVKGWPVILMVAMDKQRLALVASWVSLAFVVPCLAALLLLSLTGRVRAGWLRPGLVLLIGLAAAAVYSRGFQHLGRDGTGLRLTGRVDPADFLYTEVFAPVWFVYGVTGFTLLAAIGYLRWRGMKLWFGGPMLAGPCEEGLRTARRELIWTMVLGIVFFWTIIPLRSPPLDRDELQWIASAPTRQHVPALIQALADRSQAATVRRALLRLGPEAVPGLARALRSRSAVTRADAASALGYLAGVGALQTPHTEEMARALKQTIPALQKVLHDDASASDGAQAAGDALGEIGGELAAGVLVDALDASNTTIVQAATHGLIACHPPVREAFPILREGLESRRAGFGGPQTWNALARTGGAEAVPLLLKLVQQAPQQTPGRNRPAFSPAHSLGHIGPSAIGALPALTDALQSDNEQLRLAGILGLRSIGPAARDALPRLRELMRPESEFDGNVTLALEAFASISGPSGLRTELFDENWPIRYRGRMAEELARPGNEALASFSLTELFQILDESKVLMPRSAWAFAEDALLDYQVAEGDITTLNAGTTSECDRVRTHAQRLLDKLEALQNES